jgi:hypothetical protein
VNNVRWTFSLVLGVIMIGLGAYIALSPQLPIYRLSTGSRWLDAAFALFFLLRGWMNLRSAIRSKQRTP